MRNSKQKIRGYDLLALAGFIALYWFFISSKQRIVNYPNWILYIPLLIVYIAICIFNVRSFLIEVKSFKGNIDKLLYFLLSLLKPFLISWFVCGILLIPANYFNIYYSENNPLETIECRITGLTDYSKNSSIYYMYKGRQNIIYAHKKVMSDIYIKGDYRNYTLIATVRKGLWDTYVLQDWDIIKVNAK